MIGKQCPKCKSGRIRRGYRDTHILLRMVGIYNLLCDDCNLLFRGIVIPGSIRKRGHRRKNGAAKSSRA
jgi:hypothetical protein